MLSYEGSEATARTNLIFRGYRRAIVTRCLSTRRPRKGTDVRRLAEISAPSGGTSLRKSVQTQFGELIKTGKNRASNLMAECACAPESD